MFSNGRFYSIFHFFIEFFCICIFPLINGRAVVELSMGKIEGREIRMEESDGIGYAFMGIPYAEPPLNELRFENPVPKKPWTGTLDVKEYRAACWQNASISPQNLISEDCLYINVFTGSTCDPENGAPPCPVLLHVHGGGWEFDSVRMYKPEILVENFVSRSVIFVNFGYRLNVFGFFSTGSEAVPGNWAMRDIIEAFKWTQREIHHFGGDPTKVTLLGHSSSADAVSLLTVTPITEGLFHQVIVMSGSAMRRHSLDNSLADFEAVAKAVGCVDDERWLNPERHSHVVACMRKIDAGVLGNTFLNLRLDNDTSTSTTHAGQINRFILKDHVNIELPPRVTTPRNDGPRGLFPDTFHVMLANRRPMKTLIGTTVNEAGSLNYGFKEANPFSVAQMCQFIMAMLAGQLKRPAKVAQACKLNYGLLTPFHDRQFSGSNFSFWSRLQTSMFSDLGNHAPTFREVQSLLSVNSTVYLYNFEYERRNLEGVSPWHSMDLTYLTEIHKFPFDDLDHVIKRIYLALMNNFVKYGDPTPSLSSSHDYFDKEPLWNGVQWLPVKDANYLSVDLRPMMKKRYNQNAVWFWNHLVENIENRNRE